MNLKAVFLHCKYILKTTFLKLKYFKNIKIKGILKLSKNTNVFIRDGILTLGDKISIFSNTEIALSKGEMNIGNHTFFNRNCIVVCKNKISIGNECSFGPNVCIYDHDHKFDETGFYSGEFSLGTVEIGNKCWIGAGSIILKNTKIGDGCIIGAGCVVKGVIPPYSLVTSERNLKIIPLEKRNKNEIEN